MPAIALIGGLLAGVVIGVIGGIFAQQRLRQGRVETAERSAARILNEADRRQKEILLEAKEESIRFRQQAESELRDRRKEVQRTEQRVAIQDDLGRELGSQEAGYKFQSWFYDLLDFSEISNRKPYVHDGRQIDGSVTVSGTTYFVELKFTTKQADASDIDTFHKKVTTKADNTMGIMISISGYSSVARQEASGERTPLLLLDHGHLYLVLGGVMGLADVIERVRRHASQTGEAYLPASEFSA